MDSENIEANEMVVDESDGGGEEVGNDNVPVTAEQLPWTPLRDFFDNVRKKDPNNWVARCVTCKKSYSCAVSSASNFEKHLRKHPIDFALFEEKRAKTEGGGGKRKRSGGYSNPSRQTTLTTLRDNGPAALVTQKLLDGHILKAVVMNNLPFGVVDSPDFKKLLLLGLRPSIQVMCRQTLTRKLETLEIAMRKELKAILAKIEVVSTTADAWSKFKRAYLGMTLHWIDPKTFDRKSAAIGVRRVIGSQTNVVLAKNIDEVQKDWEVQNKVCKTTTDNGANFIKAFNDHSLRPGDNEAVSLNEEELAEDTDTNDWDSPIPLTTSLDKDLTAQDDDYDYDVILPAHQRCAAHTLNLVASKDAFDAIKTPVYNKIFSSSMTKLRKLWTRPNMSTKVADCIHSKLGVYLTVPTPTRWNSDYDSVRQVSDIATMTPDKLHSVFDSAGLPRLTTNEIQFLAVYSKLTGHLAKSLDILQGEKKMYLGYLLPTIVSLRKKIQESFEELVHCKPLATAVLNGISKRFGDLLENDDTILAACVHPKFKLDWVDSRAEKRKATTLLKSALTAEAIRQARSETQDSQVQVPASAVERATGTRQRAASDDDEDFFSFQTTTARSRDSPPSSAEETAETEFRKFLSMDRRDLASLHEFPLIKNVFIQSNTTLPSSAAVERLFSLSGLVFSSLRTRLSDRHLQMQVLLKANAEYVTFQ